MLWTAENMSENAQKNLVNPLCATRERDTNDLRNSFGKSGNESQFEPIVRGASQRQFAGDAVSGGEEGFGMMETITLDQIEAPGTHTSRGFTHSTNFYQAGTQLCGLSHWRVRGRCGDLDRCLLAFSGCTKHDSRALSGWRNGRRASLRC